MIDGLKAPTAQERSVDLENHQVIELVGTWLRDRRPGAIVRFGEGEGRLLVADPDDEESLRVAANKLRRQAGLEVSSSEVLQIKALVTTALDEADVLGIRGSDWFSDEHQMWVARIEDIFARRLAEDRAPAYVCHCLVSGQLRDALPQLLSAEEQISVVSSRDVKAVLEDAHGVDAQIYQIPSQYIMRNVDGRYEASLHNVPIWPDFYEQLRRDVVVRTPGEVFLVGAGIFGKELCIRIRELGGIALDIGSCLDQLAGKTTRGRNRPAPYRPASETSQTEERRAARKLVPYLRDTGWLVSHRTNTPVDAYEHPIPWYRYSAVDFLAERASEAHDVFEFGCGNSTLWWAARSKSVTAVEHAEPWAKRIAETAPANVSILEVPLEPDGEYCRTPRRLEEKFDVIVIDGRDRVNCGLQCLPALADDGVVIWDDSHRRRYRHGLRFLEDQGFRRIRFTGLGPVSPTTGETSVLYRSDNCFLI